MEAQHQHRREDLRSAYGRRQAARRRHGCVLIRKARETGTPVGLYLASEAELQLKPKTAREYPWATICEEHRSGCVYSTEARARRAMAEPSGWCRDCRPIALDRLRRRAAGGTTT
jgi:hypothetical protein